MSRNLVVGITGGIASGKTLVARELERRGAELVDADAVGREVVDSVPGVQKALRAAFGDSIFDADARVNRSRLAERVFTDPEALGELNRVVHPHLLSAIGKRVEAFRAGPAGRILVIDAALLVEWGARDRVDYLVVVESGREKQIERIRNRDGLSRAGALARIGAQVDPAARAAVADEVLTNDGDRSELIAKAAALWMRLEARIAGSAPTNGAGRQRE